MYLTGKKLLIYGSVLLGIYLILPFLFSTSDQDQIGNFIISGLLTLPIMLLYLLLFFYFLNFALNYYRCFRKK